MNNKYLLFCIFALSPIFSARHMTSLIKTVPSASMATVVMTNHTFYNAPRNSIDNPSWNILTNHKECAQWDELDYWNAMFEISQQSIEVPIEEFKNYYAFGYIFCVLESVRFTVLRQWKLYDYSAFWKFIHSFPDYQECMIYVYDILQKDKTSYNSVSGQAYKLICSEYFKIKQQTDEKNKILIEHQRIKVDNEDLSNNSEEIDFISSSCDELQKEL